MKIISKRQAMAIYRLHPESRLFQFCTGKYCWSIRRQLPRPHRDNYSGLFVI